MNCIDFRRALSARPACDDPEILEHRRGCVACDAFAQRQVVFEQALSKAVKIPVPEGIAARALVAHGVGLDKARRVRRRRLLIGLVAGVAIGLLIPWPSWKPEPLDRVVLAHIDAELSHLEKRNNLSPDQVNRILGTRGIAVDTGLRRVYYAAICPIRKLFGAHLVLEGEKGPVTVLLMPGETVEHRYPFRDTHREGIIAPVGRGSIAIVGQSGEVLDRIEEGLRATVSFVTGGRSGREG